MNEMQRSNIMKINVPFRDVDSERPDVPGFLYFLCGVGPGQFLVIAAGASRMSRCTSPPRSPASCTGRCTMTRRSCSPPPSTRSVSRSGWLHRCRRRGRRARCRGRDHLAGAARKIVRRSRFPKSRETGSTFRATSSDREQRDSRPSPRGRPGLPRSALMTSPGIKAIEPDEGLLEADLGGRLPDRRYRRRRARRSRR